MTKTAVLVVHGVGDTGPGKTVDALLPSLAVADPAFQQDGYQKVLWLPDLPPPGKHWSDPNTADAEKDTAPPLANDPRFDKVFPVHVRSATRDGTSYEFSEVYWADLSQVRDGWFHLLLGIFYVIFDLRHLARSAADQEGLSAWIMKWMVKLVGELLLALIAPMTVFLGLILVTCALLTQGIGQPALETYGELIMSLLGLLALVFGSFWALAMRSRSQPWLTFWSSFAFVGLFALALVGMVLLRWEWLSPLLFVCIFCYHTWRRFAKNTVFWWSLLVIGLITLPVVFLVLELFHLYPEGGLYKGIEYLVHQVSIPAAGQGLGQQDVAMNLPSQGFKLSGPVWYFAVILTVVNMVFFLQLALMLVALLAFLGRKAYCRVRKVKNDPVKIALGAAYSAAVAQITLWVFMASVLLALALRSDWAKPLEVYSVRLNRWGYFVDLLVLSISVALVGWVTWLFRNWKASGQSPRTWTMGYNRDKEVPRLLLGWLIERSLIASWLLGSVLFAYMVSPKLLPSWLAWPSDNSVLIACCVKTLQLASSCIMDKHLVVDISSQKIAFYFVTLLLISAGFMAKPLAAGLHIVMDVINHFNRQNSKALRPNRRWQEVANAFQAWKGDMILNFCRWLFLPVDKSDPPTLRPIPLEGRASAPEIHLPPYPWIEYRQEMEVLEQDHDGYQRRRRIAWRLRCVLYRLLEDSDITRLVVIAHSQGTIITIDVLNDPVVTRKLAHRKLQIDLVTMGSPFTYLYQRYFPAQFPLVAANRAHWTDLLTNVKTWINIFRIDDFVGTHIEKFDHPAGHPFVQEYPLDAGGHTNYWSQREVNNIINYTMAARLQKTL